MTDYVKAGGVNVARTLHDLVRDEIAPGTGVDGGAVWELLGDVVRELGPRNQALLDRRDDLQAQIDAWLSTEVAAGRGVDPEGSRAFLEEIGYLVPNGPAFQVSTAGIDPEISEVAGPQLVVPVDNARYALNAANARWGSLYDALYGTDILPEGEGTEKGRAYNPARGELVIAWTNRFLDEIVPPAEGSWSDVRGLSVVDGQLAPPLAAPEAFAGYVERDGELSQLLLRNHGLHIDLLIDPNHPIGRQHAAGVKDVILESAVSTIIDCEDSVSAVDAEDKARVYANWCGLMKGSLETRFARGEETLDRKLNPDRRYTAPDGTELVLPGRALLLVRHTGSHMKTDAVTAESGEPIAETFLDCVLTVLGALHDLRGDGEIKNSRAGSVYIVKPKHHGPDEVALSVDLFAMVEAAYGLPENTLKIGIMDEERRTTVNLEECIRAARERVIFINTGFLDRTGDEIHTHMMAGPVLPKPEIKSTPWMLAYEDWNVDVGLDVGLPGHAQIGKGMWAMPEEMSAMLDAKLEHPAAGASCAWVPSPTAATLHAIHYHRVDVSARQRELKTRARASLMDILTPPMLGERKLTAEQIQKDLENNAQGILGYVVRWVEQGVGCSKVPDIHDVALMEDRATLRISSQHIANWLHHGVVTRAEVVDIMKRMAAVVDRQNGGDPAYRNMAPDFDASIAFQAALDLVLKGKDEPNGYTEHTLTRRRREFKARTRP